MARFTSIQLARFDGVSLGLPMRARVVRSADPAPAEGAAEAHVASVQHGPVRVRAELTCRDTATAESLDIGRSGPLELALSAGDGSSPQREVTIDTAVLLNVEVTYKQNEPAVALLSFAGESADGLTNAHTAGDAS